MEQNLNMHLYISCTYCCNHLAVPSKHVYVFIVGRAACICVHVWHVYAGSLRLGTGGSGGRIILDGVNWESIAQKMATRNAVQCKEKW